MPCSIITTILLVLALIVSSDQVVRCKNGARPILTRTREPPFQLSFKCLCPFNYFGSDCNEYRQVLCYISKSQQAKYHPQFSDTVQFQFEMQCFLKKLVFVGDSFMQVGANYPLPLNSSVIDNQVWSNNYYIDPSLQIIWANQTSLFDDNGSLIRSNPNDSRSDQQILDSYPKFTFDYAENFFGMPYYNTKFSYNLTNVKYRNSSQQLGSVEVQLQRKSPLPLERTLVGSFNLTVDQSWFEYQVALLSLRFNQYYGEGFRTLTHTSMNTAHWRLFDPAHPKGDLLGPTHSVPTWVWVALASLFIWGLVMGGKYVGRLRQYWRKSKLRELNEEEDRND